MLGNTFNVTIREQCLPKANSQGMTLFPKGYIECVAQQTGHHLLSHKTPQPTHNSLFSGG